MERAQNSYISLLVGEIIEREAYFIRKGWRAHAFGQPLYRKGQTAWCMGAEWLKVG